MLNNINCASCNYRIPILPVHFLINPSLFTIINILHRANYEEIRIYARLKVILYRQYIDK